jgi:hypothetical protein
MKNQSPRGGLYEKVRTTLKEKSCSQEAYNNNDLINKVFQMFML